MLRTKGSCWQRTLNGHPSLDRFIVFIELQVICSGDEPKITGSQKQTYIITFAFYCLYWLENFLVLLEHGVKLSARSWFSWGWFTVNFGGVGPNRVTSSFTRWAGHMLKKLGDYVACWNQWMKNFVRFPTNLMGVESICRGLKTIGFESNKTQRSVVTLSGCNDWLRGKKLIGQRHLWIPG